MMQSSSRRHCMRNMLSWGILYSGAGTTLSSLATTKEINLGVTVQRIPEQTQNAWSGIASYLSQVLQRKVNILPIPISRVFGTVAEMNVDAVFCNPNQAVLLKELKQAQILCSLSGPHGPRFGGVIVTNKSSQILSVDGLRAKPVIALGRQSAGGYLFQARHLKKKGLLAKRDYGVQFAENQDEALWALRKGIVAAAFIRSGMLEQMQQESYIDVSNFTVLDQRYDPTFPLLHSTDLYPDRYLVAMPEFAHTWAAQIKSALLALNKESKILTGTGVRAFIEPLGTDALEQAMRELNMAPFDTQA